MDGSGDVGFKNSAYPKDANTKTPARKNNLFIVLIINFTIYSRATRVISYVVRQITIIDSVCIRMAIIFFSKIWNFVIIGRIIIILVLLQSCLYRIHIKIMIIFMDFSCP